MTLARETARNALLMITARTSSLFISVGSVFFYTRWLKQDELAFLTVLGVLTQSCIIFSDLGLGLAVDRRLPGLMESDPKSGRDLARGYLWATSLVAGFICLILTLLAGPISRVFLDSALPPSMVVWSIPYVAASVGHQLLTILLRGSRNYATLSLCVPINQILWSVLSIGAYVLIAAGHAPRLQAFAGDHAAIKMFVLLQGIGQAPALIIFSRPIWKLLAGTPTWDSVRENLRRALPFHAERYINFIAAYGDQWVVAAFMTNELKAIYYVPRTFFDRLTTTLDGITAVPLTALSTAAGRSPDSLLRGILVMRRALLYIFGMMGASLLISSRLLVDVIAGSKYHAGGVTPFRILAIHFMIIGMFIIHQQAVNAAGRPGDRLRVVIIQNIASLAGLALLGWLFSLNGVAAARIVAAVAGGWASWHYVRKIVPLTPDWTAIRAIAIPCLTVVVTVLIGQSFHYSGTREPSHILLGFTRMGLAIATMGLLLLRFMPEADLRHIEEVLPTRLNWMLAVGRRLRGDKQAEAVDVGTVSPVVPTGKADPTLEDISGARL